MTKISFLPLVVLSLLTFSLSSVQAEEHEWVNAKGRVIRAEFVSATTDTVTISMKGKTYVLKLDELSPQSQDLARTLSTGDAYARPAIGFSALFLSNPYCKEMVAAMQADADQRGAELLVQDARFDAKKLSDQIDAFITQKVKAIVLVPMGPVAVGPAIKRANSAGIPVFTIDFEFAKEDAQIAGHVGNDNYQGGQLAGQAMIEALAPKGGKVLVLDFKQASACVLRVKGFREVVDAHNKKGEASAIEIVAQADGGANQRPSEQATADALITHPDLAGIFAINDPSALGAYQAAKAAGKENEVKIIGFDGTKEGRAAIKAGKIYAAPISFPDRMGRRVMENVFAHLTGKEFKQVDLVPTEIYRQEDALAEEEAPVQAPTPVPQELPKTLFDRVWKDKKGRLIMAKFVSLDGDDLTITMRGVGNFELKLSSLSSESQSLARALARIGSGRKLSAGEVAELLGREIGTWKVNGHGQPTGGEREEIEDVMEIRWKEIGKSFVATFSPVINGKEVPFVGTKEYDAETGFFLWRSKGEGFPANLSFECYDPVAKSYHGKFSSPDEEREITEFGFYSMIDGSRHVGKWLIFADGELVYTRQLNFLRTEERVQVSGPQPEAPSITLRDVNSGNLAEIKRKLEQGADPNVIFSSKATALHRACNLGQANIVRLLLARGANPNALNAWKMTALDVLMSPDQKGRAPLDRMSAERQTTIRALLEKAGGKRSLRDPSAQD